MVYIEDINCHDIRRGVGFLSPIDKNKYWLKQHKHFYELEIAQQEQIKVKNLDTHQVSTMTVQEILGPLETIAVTANHKAKAGELLLQDICCLDNKPQQLSYKDEHVEHKSGSRYVHFRYQKRVISVIRDLDFLKTESEQRFARTYLQKATFTDVPGLSIEKIPPSCPQLENVDSLYRKPFVAPILWMLAVVGVMLVACIPSSKPKKKPKKQLMIQFARNTS